MGFQPVPSAHSCYPALPCRVAACVLEIQVPGQFIRLAAGCRAAHAWRGQRESGLIDLVEGFLLSVAGIVLPVENRLVNLSFSAQVVTDEAQLFQLVISIRSSAVS